MDQEPLQLGWTTELTLADLISYLIKLDIIDGNLERISVCTASHHLILYVGVAAMEEIPVEVTHG